jgi:hypothetical protein
MRFAIYDVVGKSLDTIIGSYAGSNGYVLGPATLATLASQGWVTVINPTTVNKFYAYDASAAAGDVGTFCYPQSSSCNVTGLLQVTCTTSTTVSKNTTSTATVCITPYGYASTATTTTTVSFKQ